MKKNFIIGILSVFASISLVFAYQQKRVALASAAEASNAQTRADSLHLIVIHEAEVAQRNLALATKVYNEQKAKFDSLNGNKK